MEDDETLIDCVFLPTSAWLIYVRLLLHYLRMFWVVADVIVVLGCYATDMSIDAVITFVTQ